MPTYEMFWDCPSCGTEKLLGKSHRHCPNCGAVQDPAFRYFPAEHEKVAVEDHVFHGVDWVCERCDTPNAAAATHCVNCGDLRDGVEADAVRRPDTVAGQQPGRSLTRSERAAAVKLPGDERPQGWQGWLRARWKTLLLVLVATVLVCTGLGVGSWFWTEAKGVEVTGHSWSRDIFIEKLAPRRDGSWCDGMPYDAYSVSRSERQRGTKQIPDGESCSTVNVDNGDGTYSTRQSCHTTYRSEPIYDTWCDYTVDRWQRVDTRSAGGRSLTPAPHWPSVSVDGCASLGCRRIGGRREVYTVHMRDDDGDDQACAYGQGLWSSMGVGSRWTARKRVIWDNLVCDGLEPEEGA